jgi:hypothetical protein
MRLLVEGVRLEDRDKLQASLLAATKARRLLTEALVRTPPTISSRQLIEEALQLLLGLESILNSLVEENRGSPV